MDISQESLDYADTLKQARQLISKEENWCKGWYGKKNDGSKADLFTEAVMWCAEGAIHMTTKNWQRGFRIIDKISEGLKQPLAAWNDIHTHEEVLELFDNKIKEWE